MDSCCEKKGSELAGLHQKHGYVLKIVLSINLIMFFVEFGAGWIANSVALMSDSLDMLGDASVYAFSLYVLHRGERWKAGAALAKGVLITLFGFWALAEAILKTLSPVVPQFEVMGSIALLALAANASCLFLLYKFRNDDINMKSTFICSRNDITANTGVLIASGAVAWFDSNWPDTIVGFIIAIIFLRSAVQILRESVSSLRLGSKAL